MKRAVSLILAVALCMALAACGGGQNHTCAGVEWVVKEEATCAKQGIKEHICTCGKVVATETISLGAHTYVDGVCEICGAMDPTYYPESMGLEFVDIGGGELKLVGIGSCEDEMVVIPKYEGSFKVVAVERKAFLNNRKITAVIIPDSVETIGEEAFKNCTKLTSVIIGDGVKTISKSAFGGCENLATVEMGSSIQTIGQYAFSGCSNLAAISIPASVTKMEWGAFSQCDALTTVTIPGNAGLVLDTDLFSSCDSLHTAVIGNGIEMVPIGTFRNCTSLTDVTLPDTVKVIGNEAFKGCSSLAQITLPNGITKIWNAAFQSCTSLTEIVIPETVTELGDGAFMQCTQLKKVTINATTALEYKYQFVLCDALEEISIPEDLAGQYAGGWQDMAHVMQLPIVPGVVPGPSSEGLEFISYGNGTCYLSGRGTCTDTVIRIPETSPAGDVVIEIGEYVFNGSYDYDIKQIYVPETVTVLGRHAFDGCSNLQKLDLPSGLIAGYADALYDNNELTDLTLRCSSIFSFPVDAIIRPEESFFSEVIIYVPAELVEEYKASSGWKYFGDNIRPIS